jgi:hypothetical protein
MARKKHSTVGPVCSEHIASEYDGHRVIVQELVPCQPPLRHDSSDNGPSIIRQTINVDQNKHFL